jgi:hypothetical protein
MIMAILAMTCFMFAFETQGIWRQRLVTVGSAAALVQVLMWL